MREGAVDTGEGQGCAEEGAQPALGRDRVTTAADCRGPRATRPGNGGGDACALLPLWAPGLGTRWNRAVLLPVVAPLVLTLCFFKGPSRLGLLGWRRWPPESPGSPMAALSLGLWV